MQYFDVWQMFPLQAVSRKALFIFESSTETSAIFGYSQIGYSRCNVEFDGSRRHVASLSWRRHYLFLHMSGVEDARCLKALRESAECMVGKAKQKEKI